MRRIELQGEEKGYHVRESPIEVSGITVNELYEPGAGDTNMVSMTFETELGSLSFWLSIGEAEAPFDALTETTEWVAAAIDEEMEILQRARGY